MDLFGSGIFLLPDNATNIKVKMVKNAL